MIKFVQGNIFNSGADVLVNPVNLRGVSGAGLALKFKQKFSDNFEIYRKSCKDKVLKFGNLTVVEFEHHHPRYIFNVPTKDHWGETSEIKNIRLGLEAIVLNVMVLDVISVAVPALGCGLGGASWKVVKKLMEEILILPRNVIYYIYEPESVWVKIEDPD